jgi:DnaJ domain
MTSSHYDVLNVPFTAPLATIKEAYRILVKKYHPDKVQDVSTGTIDIDVAATTKREEHPFLRIQAAWECLRDTDQRRQYDELLTRQQLLHTQQQELIRQKHQNAILINIDVCQACRSNSIDDVPVPESPTDLVGTVEEQVVDWFYRCRCGYELYVAQSYSLTSNIGQQIQLLPYDTDESYHQPDSMILQCVGCTLFYDISPLFRREPERTVSEAIEQGFSNHNSFNTKKAKT